MDVYEAINYVKDHGGHRLQYRYDFNRERIYGYVALQVAALQAKSVLDAGCAYGTLSFFLRRAGIAVTAIDIDPSLHSAKLFTEEGITFFESNLETEAIKGQYDCCLLTDVLEHFNYNPLPVLKKIRKSCRSIVITTPARELDYAAPDTALYADYVTWRMIPERKGKYRFINAHHHTYTKFELKDLLEEAGFKIVHSKLLPVERTWVIVAV